MNLFDLFAKVSLDTGDYDRGVQDVAKSGDTLAGKLKNGLATAGKMAAAGIAGIAGAATGGIMALNNLAESTREYREEQGKLNTAFSSAGFSSGLATEAYRSLYSVLGDSGQATEASQLLAKLADNTQQVSDWTTIATGVVGTFGDSLPVESLIEAANETAKVGTVTGTLADALNWAGISEDAFNQQLAACADETERTALITDTLNGLYGEAAGIYAENNDELIKARENQAKLQDAMAKVGGAVDTVKNAFLEKFAPAIEETAGRAAEFIENIDVDQVAENVSNLVQRFKDLLPVISGVVTAFVTFKTVSMIAPIITAVTTAIQGMSVAQIGLNTAMKANPIGLIISLIVSLISYLITLWTTNEEFRAKVMEIWEGIKGVFVSAWENIKAVWDMVQPYFAAIWENIKAVFLAAWEGIKAVWDTVQPYFAAIWEGIKTVFSVVSEVLGGFFSAAWTAIKTVWDVVTGFFSQIWNTIKGIFSVVKSVLSGDFQGAWDAIKGIVSGWADYFKGVWNKIKDVFGDAWEKFKDVGKKIVDGIKEGIKNAWEGLKSWFSNLWDSLFGNNDVNVNVKTTRTDGSHAGGLSYVPFDGYVAELHQGEMVLTKAEANALRHGKVSFAQSGLGTSTAGLINGLSNTGRQDTNLTVNLVLPDGTKLASYLLPMLDKVAKANGTPILNPR